MMCIFVALTLRVSSPPRPSKGAHHAERDGYLEKLAYYVLVAFAVAGCGSSKTAPVEGVVLLDGKPLAGASIQFVPEGAGRDATGESDKNGQFAMSTFQPRDGVLPGTYKVVISPSVGSADTTKYGSAEEAMAAAAKRPVSKPSGAAFPLKYTRPDQTPLTQEVPVKGKVTFDLKN